MARTSIAAQIAALKRQQLALEKKQAAMRDTGVFPWVMYMTKYKNV